MRRGKRDLRMGRGPAGRRLQDRGRVMADDTARRRTHEVFMGHTEAVPRARHLIADHLRAWGLGGLDDLIGALELAVAELITNAVQHGRAPIDLVMTLLPGRVRVEVHDRGGGRPAIRVAHTSGPDIGGFGLRLVDELVDRWGSTTSPDRTVVWVEHALPTPPGGTASGTTRGVTGPAAGTGPGGAASGTGGGTAGGAVGPGSAGLGGGLRRVLLCA